MFIPQSAYGVRAVASSSLSCSIIMCIFFVYLEVKAKYVFCLMMIEQKNMA